MPNGNPNYGNFNQGVNYMNPGQQQMPGQPMPGQQPVMPQQPTPVAPVGAPAGGNAMLDKLKNNKTMMVGVIAGVVVLLLVIKFFGSKLLNPSYNIVNKYMSGMKSMNAEKIAKLYDETMIEALQELEIPSIFHTFLIDHFDYSQIQNTTLAGFIAPKLSYYILLAIAYIFIYFVGGEHNAGTEYSYWWKYEYAN